MKESLNLSQIDIQGIIIQENKENGYGIQNNVEINFGRF